MRTSETNTTFPLSSVKPLDQLTAYRRYCLEATRRALEGDARSYAFSPLTQQPLVNEGAIEGLAYLRCSATGSLFLAKRSSQTAWSQLLRDVASRRHGPDAVHGKIARSRAENVHKPKLAWIEQTLRLQTISKARIAEAATAPGELKPWLEASQLFGAVFSVDEMAFCHGEASLEADVDAVVLMESLDRVDDPAGLVAAAFQALEPGGLLFVTALVASGFDMSVLGLRNLYLYPPDRTNCFSVAGLQQLLTNQGFQTLELSTPGVLDVEIVQSHRQRGIEAPLSVFEKGVLDGSPETRAAFQVFLQQQALSSYARLVGRKP